MALYQSAYTGEQIDEAVERASVGGAIDASLSNLSNGVSNKADKYGTLVNLTTLQSVQDAAPGEYSWVQVERWDWQPSDIPNGGIRMYLSKFAAAPPYQSDNFFLRCLDGGMNLTMYIGEAAGDEGIRWAKLTTATTPTEYNLPMTDGYSASEKNTYFKTQDNVVTVILGAHGMLPTALTTVANLPVGFRPSNIMRTVFSSSINDMGRVLVYSNGEIQCQFNESTTTFFGGQFSFIAGN